MSTSIGIATCIAVDCLNDPALEKLFLVFSAFILITGAVASIAVVINKFIQWKRKKF